MGQREVIELLKANRGKRFTSREISKRIGGQPTNIAGVCSNLVRYGFIKAAERIGANGYEWWIP